MDAPPPRTTAVVWLRDQRSVAQQAEDGASSQRGIMGGVKHFVCAAAQCRPIGFTVTGNFPVYDQEASASSTEVLGYDMAKAAAVLIGEICTRRCGAGIQI